MRVWSCGEFEKESYVDVICIFMKVKNKHVYLFGIAVRNVI